jgi:hypothetical protein
MLETRVTDVHDTAPQIVDQLLVALLRPPRTLLDSCRTLTLAAKKQRRKHVRRFEPTGAASILRRVGHFVSGRSIKQQTNNKQQAKLTPFPTAP